MIRRPSLRLPVFPLAAWLVAACPGERAPSRPAAPDAAITEPPPPADPPAQAQRSDGGIAYQVRRPGAGSERPAPYDMVEVHYTSWAADGTVLDDSRARNAPAQFEVDTASRSWTEALVQMVAGERRRLWLPSQGGRSGDAAAAVPRVYDLELLKIIRRPRPPDTPADVARPPPQAKRTPSGLAYRVLQPGHGDRHPRAGDTIVVHYSGWTADGKLFDSSITRGTPSTLVVGAPGTLAGWNEAVKLMVPGEKSRFWLPAALAYGKNPMIGQPAGPLVFDVELLAIR